MAIEVALLLSASAHTNLNSMSMVWLVRTKISFLCSKLLFLSSACTQFSALDHQPATPKLHQIPFSIQHVFQQKTVISVLNKKEEGKNCNDVYKVFPSLILLMYVVLAGRRKHSRIAVSIHRKMYAMLPDKFHSF